MSTSEPISQLFQSTTAKQEGHSVLYHWQRFEVSLDRTDEDRLVQFLRTGKLRCSSPATFNDPWDCGEWFNTAILQSAEEREKFANFLSRSLVQLPPAHLARFKPLLEKLKNHDADATRFMLNLAHVISVQKYLRYRIYCLAPDPTKVLMWSHYANNHKGICLEFNVGNKVFSGAHKCVYLSKYPTTPFYESESFVPLRTFLSKSDVWEYESEFRLITHERSIARTASENMLLTDESFLQLPDGALSSIIVGLRGNYAEVRRIVKENDPSVKVKRAVMASNSYRLTIED